MGILDTIGLGGSGNIPQASFDPMALSTGLGTTSFEEGMGSFELAPELQETYQQLLGTGRGALSAAQDFDPYSAAETLFGRMEGILAGGRERERQGLESRLLAQGRLGSTGGLFQQQGLEQAIEAQRAQALNQAFGQAQDVQQGLFGRGLAGIQAATGLQQLGQQQLSTGIQAGAAPLQAQMFNIQQQQQQQQLMPSLLAGLGTGALTGYMMRPRTPGVQ